MQKNQSISLPEKVYLVGGYVRDREIGIEPGDKDWVVVGSNPDEMKAKGFIQVGKDFPVFIHPITNEEYALARIETKKGQGYHGFNCEIGNVSLVEDLIRRDITINSMALEIDQFGNEKIIDPFGGRKDIDRKIIRHSSSAFAEDPLRVIRVARFLAKFHYLGFRVDSQTLELIKAMVNRGEINHLTKERIWLEIEKVCFTKSPEIFFIFLNEIGALDLLFDEYSNQLQSDWFLSLNRIFENSNYSKLIRIAILFFGYPHKNQLCDMFRLSNQEKKLFSLLHFHQRTFNELLISDFSETQARDLSYSLCALYKDCGILKEKSLINEFLVIQMAMKEIDLNHSSLKKFIVAMMAYSSQKVSDFVQSQQKKSVSKGNHLTALVESFRVDLVYQALISE